MEQEGVGETGGNGWWTEKEEKIRMCVIESGRHNTTHSQTFSFIHLETKKEQDEEFGQPSGKPRATADIFIKHYPILGPE